jgi:hypothetical protein
VEVIDVELCCSFHAEVEGREWRFPTTVEEWMGEFPIEGTMCVEKTSNGRKNEDIEECKRGRKDIKMRQRLVEAERDVHNAQESLSIRNLTTMKKGEHGSCML